MSEWTVLDDWHEAEAELAARYGDGIIIDDCDTAVEYLEVDEFWTCGKCPSFRECARLADEEERAEAETYDFLRKARL